MSTAPLKIPAEQPATLGIAPLAKGFRDGSDDPVKALDRALAAADLGKDDHALLWRDETARAAAEASRARFEKGAPLGPLDGIPLVIKDCIDLAGLPTTNGTKFLLEKKTQDSPVVSRLKAAGAVIFGKANMHEFGIQPTGVNPHHGTAVNPWAPDCIPGGSSAGSAVAVASGIAPAALGTDAGGSVRVPAALNGLVGLKPTFGSVPDDGVAKLTRDLDHVGPIGWTVEDVTLLFEAIAATSIDRSIQPGRVAVLEDFFTGADEGVQKAVSEAIAQVFGELPREKTPMCRWATAVEFVIVGTDAATLIGDLLKKHASEMGPDARTILQLGAGLSADDRRKADGVRKGMKQELDALLARYDVLVGPAVGRFAPPLTPAARAGELDTDGMARLAAVTFPANLTGLPCCTVPCVTDGLPTGVQIIGRAGDEARVLAAARAIQAAFPPRRPVRWFGS